MKRLDTTYLIIGCGIAGLSAASHCAKSGDVLVMTKGRLPESATQYAQGGIAVALQSDDAPQLHFEDTIRAGDGLCDEEAVRVLVEDGPKRVQQLINLGAQFDQTEGQFVFAKEGAHQRRRILHVADATGREIEKTLGRYLRSQPSVQFMENTCLIDLIVEDNQCFGAIAIHADELVVVTCQAVVIATGGCGQVYSRTTNPAFSTGDGIAVAAQAGAYLQDMEFMQFHPTALYRDARQSFPQFLISEAVRGEGARLLNDQHEPFMKQYHQDAELAPRDIVARAILEQMSKSKVDHVFLDLRNLEIDVPKRFPTIYKTCLSQGLDITNELIPVAPAAHYFMGGIQTTIDGQTSIESLYGAGEAASLGIHGANRLASNSLLDGLVFGFRAARHACQRNRQPVSDQTIRHHIDKWILPNVIDINRSELSQLKTELRTTMWDNVGLARDHKGLLTSLSIIRSITEKVSTHLFDKSYFELKSMAFLAQAITQSALSRTESRGAHYRKDYPNKNDPQWSAHQVIEPGKLPLLASNTTA